MPGMYSSTKYGYYGEHILGMSNRLLWHKKESHSWGDLSRLSNPIFTDVMPMNILSRPAMSKHLLYSCWLSTDMRHGLRLLFMHINYNWQILNGVGWKVHASTHTLCSCLYTCICVPLKVKVDHMGVIT